MPDAKLALDSDTKVARAAAIRPVRTVLIGLLRLWRYALSPMLPPACRFYPSCSEYAEQAMRMHGIFKGSLLTGQRLLRCHPLGPTGYDPVPTNHNPKCKSSY
ncbi:MAG: membrane protein insertion efficiency factor YidD [Gammaproteobacteria bacterium]